MTQQNMLAWNVAKMPLPLENLGIDPGTSRMLSGRSTIWANSPAHMHISSKTYDYLEDRE